MSNKYSRCLTIELHRLIVALLDAHWDGSVHVKMALQATQYTSQDLTMRCQPNLHP